ncbi:MAG TPA: RiPP maturation radical SAM C-methyltransferase [Thermoanaerobaculia bacterium]|nr:RiPP maturation radical SAM C-methyltransferase [Thermoanaerobaculia bacterium]
MNMPFATLQFPSIALTQLKSVAESRFGEKVRVRILYLNHDFAQYLGVELYQVLNSIQASNAGLGDWMFRALAFPGQPDNTDAYFQRYYPQRTPAMEMRRRLIREKRQGLERFMDGLAAKHRLAGEDVVGFTTMFAQNAASFAMARLVKKRNPAVTTVVGGANCEAPMGKEVAQHVPAVDYVFSGPALISFPDFLQHRLDGDTEACEQIRGVFSKTNVERLQGQEAIGQELPIDVPVPLDYDEFLVELSRNFPGGKIEPYLLFETSRGCWWGERAHCTFCGLNGGTMAYRAMPSVQALQLFEDMFARYSSRCKRFDAVDNIMPREYLTEVFPYVKAPEGVSLFYEVKADLKDREMEVLGKSGVNVIQPGIEALSSGTLKLMKKGVTAFQNIRFLKSCLRYDIAPAWNLLIGFPGEKEDVYRKYVADMPLLHHLTPPSGAFPVRFDRYSPYFTRADEYGLKLSPYDFYRFVYPFPEEVLMNLAYFFEDRNYASEYLSTMVVWQDKLNKGTATWAERFNGFDGRPRASLTLEPRAQGAVVRDTRSGELVLHEMDELDTRILMDVDSNGWRLVDIAGHVDADASSVAGRIERLRSLGLIFDEGERLMSVVLAPIEQAAEDMPLIAAAKKSLPVLTAAS